MTATAETINETVLTAAAEMAEKLGMTRVKLNENGQMDWQALSEDDLMMLVTADGITIGRVNASYGEARTYRYEIYNLNRVEILEKRYGITEAGWEHMPAITYSLHKDTIIYTGW